MLNKSQLVKFLRHSAGISGVGILAVSCGALPQNLGDSQITTVNITHSGPKRQSIGNCWLYAHMGWIESMAMKASEGKSELNLSESYLTYRHFEDQLLGYFVPSEISTGGSFRVATRLIEKYGVMNEGDFLPLEGSINYSATQNAAEKAVNESLKNGALSMLRTTRMSNTDKATLIRKELDSAFGVEMGKLTDKIITADSIIVETNGDNNVTLKSIINRFSENSWTEVDFPFSEELESKKGISPKPNAAQDKLLRRVFKAMNDGHPVMIAWFVDFNALKDGGFSLETLNTSGPGRQGYHLTLLEDYVVKGLDPNTGKEFITLEGEATAEEKERAATYGNLEYFVTKNSWGVSETSTYLRDGSYGYHKLFGDYLFSLLKETDSQSYTGKTMGLTSFILPAGY